MEIWKEMILEKARRGRNAI